MPIVLPRRIPVTRFDSDATDGTPGWPIAAWTHSVYEELEPLGTMATMADPESGDLTVELEITDDRLADDEVPIEQTIRTRRNPHGDLAVLTLRTDEGTRSFLVEIGAFGIRGRHPLVEFGANGEILNSWPEAVVFHGSNDGSPAVHRFEIRVPEVSADTIRGIQMELADNDRSYHTQWRRLAPRGAMLEFPASTPNPSP